MWRHARRVEQTVPRSVAPAAETRQATPELASHLQAVLGNQETTLALGAGDAFHAVLHEALVEDQEGMLPGVLPWASNSMMLRRMGEALDAEAAAERMGRSSGTPLSAELRSRMETAFDHSFAHVRVHHDGHAAAAAEAVNAHAVAVGPDIFFGRGAFAPGTPEGERLLAHELTHVVQHDEGRLAGKSGVSSPSDATEREAYANEVRIPTTLATLSASSDEATEAAGPSLGEAPAEGTGLGSGAGVAGPVEAAPGGAAMERTPVTPVPATTHTPEEILGDGTPANRGMTFQELDTYTRAQADWFAASTLSGAQRDQIRAVLAFVRSSPAILVGCADMRVGDLVGRGLTPAVLDPLTAYARGSQGDNTLRIETPTADMARGLQLGQAIRDLEAVVQPLVLMRVMTQAQLERLIDETLLARFVLYVTTFHPVLQAANGKETESWLQLVVDDGADPQAYTSLIPNVRSIHRFERAALDTLVNNFAAHHQTARPLVLILHSALDHNGAFHRDPNLTQVITSGINHTLMIEGVESMSAITGMIQPIAQEYGQNGHIAQVMIAGHGNARLMELTGTVAAEQDPAGDEVATHRDDIDLDSNREATERLMDTLLQNMENDPAHPGRIVFNACLTNSNDVDPGIQLDPDPAVAAQQVNQAIRDNASLATWMQNRARDQGRNIESVGANSSIGQVRLIDPATGQLNIVSDEDPAATADKLTYVENGTEPEGALRAVLECWAATGIGPTRTFDAMRRRTGRPAGTAWDETIILTFYTRILAAYQANAQGINAFAHAAGGLSEAKFSDPASANAARIYATMPAAETDTVYTALTGAPEWSRPHVPVVIQQAWMRRNTARQADLLTTLGSGSRTCASVRDFVKEELLDPVLGSLLPAPSPGTADRGPLLLALLYVGRHTDAPPPTARAFLRAAANNQRQFPATLPVEDLVVGFSTAQQILDAIGLGAGADTSRSGGGATPQDGNVDLDHSGTNEAHVEPMTRTAATTASFLNVRSRPSMQGRIIGSLPRGASVFLAGRAGNWYAIEHGTSGGGERMAFVYKDWVVLQAP